MLKQENKNPLRKETVLTPIIQYQNENNSSVNTISFYDNQIIAGCSDHKIHFYHSDINTCIKTYEGNESKVNIVKIYENKLYSSNQQGQILVYNLQTDQLLSKFEAHKQQITCLNIDNSGRLFSGSADKTIKLWNKQNGTLIKDFQGHTDLITRLHITKENKLYSSSIDKTLKSWDIETGKMINNFESHKGWVLNFQFDETNNLLYSGSHDSTIKIWDTRLNKCIHTFQEHKYAVSQVLINGSTLISSSWDGNIGLWNLKNKKKSPTFLKGHFGQVRGILLKGNSKLYSYSNDSDIRFWDLKKKKCKNILNGHSKPIYGLQFDSKDRLFSFSSDGTIVRWPSSENKNRKSIEMEKEELKMRQSTLFLQGLSSKIEVFINNKPYWTTTNNTILNLCKSNGIEVLSFCHHSRLSPIGICGLCSVEILNNFGEHEIVHACSYRCRQNLKIWTNTNKVKKYLQKAILALDQKRRIKKILTNNQIKNSTKHFNNNGMDVNNSEDEDEDEDDFFNTTFLKMKKSINFIDKTDSIQLDFSKCVDCGRCVQACKEIMGLNVFNMKIESPYLNGCSLETNNNNCLSETNCIDCGQCTLFCPTNALKENNTSLKLVKEKLNDPNIHIMMAISPEVLLSFPEIFKNQNFGENNYENLEKKIIYILKLLGFDNIFNLELAINLSLIEETLLLHKKIQKKDFKNLPLISSCCPSFKKLYQKKYPKLLKYFSNVDLPIHIFGLLSKTIYAKRLKINPKNIFTIVLTGCVSVKSELKSESNDCFIINKDDETEKIKKIDAILSLREIGQLIKQKKIKINQLQFKNIKKDDDDDDEDDDDDDDDDTDKDKSKGSGNESNNDNNDKGVNGFNNLKYSTIFEKQKSYKNSINTIVRTGYIKSIIECYRQIIKIRRQTMSGHVKKNEIQNINEIVSDPEQNNEEKMKINKTKSKKKPKLKNKMQKKNKKQNKTPKSKKENDNKNSPNVNKKRKMIKSKTLNKLLRKKLSFKLKDEEIVDQTYLFEKKNLTNTDSFELIKNQNLLPKLNHIENENKQLFNYNNNNNKNNNNNNNQNNNNANNNNNNSDNFENVFKNSTINFERYTKNPHIYQAVTILNDRKINLLSVDGGSACKYSFRLINKSEVVNFHYIEGRACPLSCVGGGGHPKTFEKPFNKRMKLLKSLISDSKTPKFKKIQKKFYIIYQNIKLNNMKNGNILNKQNLNLKKQKLKNDNYNNNGNKRKNENIDDEDQNSNNDSNNYNNNNKHSILILWGSQTGIAREIANIIFEKCNSLKLKTRIKSLQNFKINSLLKEENVIFVLSTYWEGSFPLNASGFWNKLQKSNLNLSNLKYSVVGVGNSSYSNFNTASILLDIHLERGCNANRIRSICLTDSQDKRGYLTSLQPFLASLKSYK
ncbi:hypothetical protein M0813_14307 [Anaeramoeba flamelloides]|uniref:Uncharacterized protein n=1 Tax=Anaeramoeba flamelloides TaxID=1746091 RepID=A0ABQ8Z5T9_9EUKA|nr:hypothetical protein M0813_14307 [Anaeramoeba flamelloides]